MQNLSYPLQARTMRKRLSVLSAQIIRAYYQGVDVAEFH